MRPRPDATHAGSADTAASATSAIHATSATRATSATHASSATSATNATTADTATALGAVSYRTSAVMTVPGCGSNPRGGAFGESSGTATCPAGTLVVGGGFSSSTAE
jgi:hypothetical protein